MTPALWTAALLITVSLLYGAAAIAYQIGARPGMALAFVGYVIANIGLIWDALTPVVK
jgi:hypothetical protein